MDEVMSVSVVIPLYNKFRHIQRAIDSVLSQTVSDFELIIINDGSTDGSEDVVRRITDSRIRLISQNNAGECAARNRGIVEAKHKMIAFLDADDEWLPTFLETVIELQHRYPEAGIYATAWSYSDGEKTWQPFFEQCVSDPQGGLLEDYFIAARGTSPVWSSAVMIPRHVFNDTGLFPVGVTRSGDLCMWAQIALRYQVAWSPLNGSVYHLSADNRACNLSLKMSDVSMASVIEEYLIEDNPQYSSRSIVLEYLVYWRLQLARHCYLSGDKMDAIVLLNKTRRTKLFKMKWLKLLLAILLPLQITKSILFIKNKIKYVMLQNRS